MLIAPNAATYATRVPYITPNEFKAHPTGVDAMKLVTGSTATPAANDQALLQIIRRASSMADGIAGNKILAATVDTQAGKYLVQRDGTIRIILDWSPVVAVDTVTVGTQPGAQTPLVQDANWDLNGRTLTVPAYGAVSSSDPGSYITAGSRVYATARYINGWANAVFTAAVPVGANSLPVSNALGIMPGMTIALVGAEVSEFVVVSPSFVPSTSVSPTNVPLLAPTSFAYAVGEVATAFPADVKLAVIFLTAGIIKARGAKALVMGSTRSTPETETKPDEVNAQEMALAEEILSIYRRTI